MPSATSVAGLLLFGLVLGMKHALEADHVAAVAALATRSRTVGQTVRQGLAWGAGHALTLFVFGGAVLAMEGAVPQRLANVLELAVGVMLIVLGVDVLRRLHAQRVHFHVHHHDGGIVHVHAHSHAHDHGPHDPAHHRHMHPAHFPLRALLVGMMHGMAGTAALIVLIAGSARSLALGVAQLAVFGVGSMLGMAVLSLAIAIPLRVSARMLERAYGLLQGAAGLASASIGGAVLWQALQQS